MSSTRYFKCSLLVNSQFNIKKYIEVCPIHWRYFLGFALNFSITNGKCFNLMLLNIHYFSCSIRHTKYDFCPKPKTINTKWHYRRELYICESLLSIFFFAFGYYIRNASSISWYVFVIHRSENVEKDFGFFLSSVSNSKWIGRGNQYWK